MGMEKVMRTAHGIHLSQSKYISELLHRVGMADCKPVQTPISTSTKLYKIDGQPLTDALHCHQV